MDIADLTKRRTSLTEQEKYYFYSHKFTPDVSYQFPHKDGQLGIAGCHIARRRMAAGNVCLVFRLLRALVYEREWSVYQDSFHKFQENV